MMRGNLIGSIGRITPRLETLESRLTPDASAQAVVTGLYHRVLLREPDAAGLAAHTRALERGATPAEVAGALYFSHEFRQAQTQRFFENLLGRDGDQAGLDNWVDHLIDGLPEETVAAAMASSPEYTARFNRPEDLVTRWYLDLLGRQPDSVGLAAHTRALESGHSAYAVTSALTASAEFRSVKIRQVYFAALGRDADTAGLQVWASRWQALGGLGGVTAGILGSAENHARLVSTAGVPLPDQTLANQWASILRAPYDGTEDGFVKMYNRLLQTVPQKDENNNPVYSEPGNIDLWNLSRNNGDVDGLPDDEKRQVTPVSRPAAYPVTGLLPTQNEVDMDQSLKYPLRNPVTLELYLKGGDIQHPGGLIITGGDGRYVLNGHHRWSTIYTINPQARILSVDIGLGETPQELLKATQIAVGADLGFLPVAVVAPGNNLFEVSEPVFRAKVESLITGNADGGQAVMEVFARYGYADMTAVQDHLWANVQQLRANNKPAVDVKRDYMPEPLEDDPAPVAAWMRSGMLNFRQPVIPTLG